MIVFDEIFFAEEKPGEAGTPRDFLHFAGPAQDEDSHCVA